MTDEQIKQNAYNYLDNLNRSGIILTGNEIYNAYLTGAHSRDEEIKELNARILNLMCERDSIKSESEYLIDKFRNPWINVEDRLPKNNCVVFVSLDGTEYLSAHYRAKSKRFVTISKDKQTLIEVRKSAATYTVCGDCIKEERLYSEGQREDITSLVTHWMSIPKLKKGK